MLVLIYKNNLDHLLIRHFELSYKTFFSVSAGPFSVVLRPRVAGHVTLRFFCKTAFFAWLVVPKLSFCL